MAVFEYVALARDREGHEEHGRIVARDKIEVYDKLRRRGLRLLKLRKVEGMAGFLARLSAKVDR